MYYISLLVFLLFSRSAVVASPYGTLSNRLLHQNTGHPHISLHPALHPDDDLSDLNNLKAHKTSSLYYAAPPGSSMGAVSVMDLTHLYPAVQLGRSHFIKSVTCEAANTISVTFHDSRAFHTAVNDWNKHRTGFLLISYIPGCGSGTKTFERSFHLVSGIVPSEKDLRVVCQAKTIPIHETVHHDQEIRIHAATYEPVVEHPQPAANQQGSHYHPTRSFVKPHALNKADTAALSIHVHERGFFDFVGAVWNVLKRVYPPAILFNYVAEQLPFKYHVKEKFNVDTQSLKPFDATFRSDKDAYSIYKISNSSGSSEYSIEFMCVGCGIKLEIRVMANFVGTFSSGFSEANLRLETDIEATFVLGVKANYEYSDSKERRLFEKGIPQASLEIPKVLTIGAFVFLDVGIKYSLKLEGLFAAGYVCTWKTLGAILDFKEPSNSEILGDWGLAGHCERQIDAEVTLTINVTPLAKFGLGFKASLLPGVTDKLSGEVALVEKLSLPMTGSLSSAQNGDCAPDVARFQAKLELLTYILAKYSDKEKELPLHAPFEVPLWDLCFTLGRFTTDNSVVGIPEATAESDVSYPTRIVWVNNRGKAITDVTVDSDKDGMFLKVLPGDDKDDTIARFLTANNVTYATADKDSFCVRSDLINSFGFAKLDRCTGSRDGFFPVGLGKPEAAEFLVAADTLDAYFLMVCHPNLSARYPVLITNFTDTEPGNARYTYTDDDKQYLFDGTVPPSRDASGGTDYCYNIKLARFLQQTE